MSTETEIEGLSEDLKSIIEYLFLVYQYIVLNGYNNSISKPNSGDSSFKN